MSKFRVSSNLAISAYISCVFLVVTNLIKSQSMEPERVKSEKSDGQSEKRKYIPGGSEEGGAKDGQSKKFKISENISNKNQQNSFYDVCPTIHPQLLNKLGQDFLLYIKSHKDLRVNMHQPFISRSGRHEVGFDFFTKYNIYPTDRYWACKARKVLNSLKNTHFDGEIKFNVDYSPIKALTKMPNMDEGEWVDDARNCNVEQEKFMEALKKVASEVVPGSTKFFFLSGSAGSGKTFIIGKMRMVLPKANILYLSPTNLLKQSVSREFKVKSLTLFSFMMSVLCLSFYDFKNLCIHLSHLTHNIFKEVPENISIVVRSPMKKHFSLNGTNNTFIIMVDEISLKTVGELSFITYIFERLALTYNFYFIVILAGDLKQIPPLFTASMDYESIVGDCNYSIEFKSQQRMEPEYFKLVSQINACADGKECLEILRGGLEESVFNGKIEYEYPIFTEHREKNTIDELAKWFREENIGERVLGYLTFCFTNASLHYNNLMLGLTVQSQLEDYLARAGRDISIDEYIHFVVYKIQMEGFDTLTKRPFDETDDDYIIPITPLIRYMPYKYLGTTNKMIPNTSILYLLHWDSSGVLYMYSEVTDTVFKVGLEQYQNNLIGTGIKLHGYPIQLAFSNTFYSSQGLTLKRKIAIDLNRISKPELYVMLSRVKTRNDLYRLKI